MGSPFSALQAVEPVSGKRRLKSRAQEIKELRALGWTWARIAERMGISRPACHAMFKQVLDQQSRREAWGLLSGRTATALTKLGYRHWRQFIDWQPTREALLTARGVGQRTLAEIEQLLGAPLPSDLPLRHRAESLTSGSSTPARPGPRTACSTPAASRAS